MVPCRATDNRKLQIVVTKEHFQLLLTGANNFRTKVELLALVKALGCNLQGSHNWLPLPKVQNYYMIERMQL